MVTIYKNSTSTYCTASVQIFKGHPSPCYNDDDDNFDHINNHNSNSGLYVADKIAITRTVYVHFVSKKQ